MAATTTAAAALTTRKASTTTTTKAAALLASCVRAGGVITRRDDDGGKQRKIRVPKGYLPIVLVVHGGDEEEGGAWTTTMTMTETRALVRVSDLKEPCMAALLEAAEQQFGYGQQGVLRVPCDKQRFHHVVNMAGAQVVQSSDYYTSR